MELEDLFPYVMPQVKVCPEPTALHHIRLALIEFCTKTLVWQANLEITTTSSDDDYLMPLPAGSSLVKLLRAGLDASEGLDVVSPDTGISTSNCKGRVWTEDRRRVFLAPRPAIDDRVLKLRVALKPARDTVLIDDQLFEDFAPVVADGALGTLLDMSDVTWANPLKAAQHKASFRASCGVTAARVSKGFGRSTRRTKPFTR